MVEPRCYYVGAIIGAAVTIATTAYAATSQPTLPNAVSGSKKMSDATAALLPIQNQLQAAAQLGQKGSVKMPDGTTLKYDFTGYSTADANAKVADTMAKAQLQLAQKYDSKFISSALEQEKLADPQSFAARQRESELIQQQMNTPVNEPVGRMLDDQIGQELKASQQGKLDPMMKSVLDAGVADAVAARGGSANNPAMDVEGDLTTGFNGEQRRSAANQKAMSWLSSGATPTDTAYRREQQNLANLSSEVTGQTPTSQFSSLSGAQNGPTPTTQAQPNAQMPNNTGSLASQGANAQYAAQVQATPSWMSGLSALLNTGAGIVKATGAK